jgi:HAD superfamily hydrolase (TIGR01549 family)
MDRIEVIAFDLVGTLISPEDWKSLSVAHLHVITAFLAKTQGDNSIEKAAALLEKKRVDLAEELKREPTLVETFSSLGIENERFFGLIDSVNPRRYLRPNKRLAELLFKLKDRYMLAIVTDTSRKTTERAVKAYGAKPQWFHTIICGDDVVETKPSQEAFQFLLKEVNCEAQHVIFIGDREQVDLAPAKKLGMKTVLVKEGANSHADVTIGSLTEFLKLVV